MADPLTIITGAITLGDALVKSTSSLVQLINKVRNAPAELLALVKDTEDIKQFLRDILDHAREENTLLAATAQTIGYGIGLHSNSFNKAPADVLQLMKRAELNIAELQDVLAKTTVASGSGGLKVKKRAWLTQSRRLRGLTQELGDIKGSFNFYFASKSSTHSFRAALVLRQFQMENSKMWSSHIRDDGNMKTVIDAINLQIQNLKHLPEEQRKMNMLLQYISQNINAVPALPASQPAHPMATTPALTPQNACANTLYIPSSITNETSIQKEVMVSRLKLKFSRFQKESCSEFCGCICHVRSRYESPSALNRFLGSLLVGVSGIGSGCNEPSCHQQTRFSANFTYRFPAWLLSRMMSLMFFSTTEGYRGFCVQFRPYVTDFSIFRLSSIGDIPGLQRLLGERKALPSEGFYGGWTPLHYAISYAHPTVCRLLIQQGADPTREDGQNQLSALEYAWTRILGGVYPEKTRQEMEVIFDDRECLEEFGFSTIHKIVLGLAHKDLEEELNRDSLELNLQDNNGRTALSWAAQRGDLGKLRILLKYGADPNITTSKGHSPLQFAAESFSPECVKTLLEHNANPHQADPADQNPLHYTLAKPIDDLEYIMPLVDAGIDVNGPTNYNFTPLIMAVEADSIKSARFLIERGAAVNLRGQNEKTPLFFVIEYNATRCLKLLHKHGADFSLADERGATILHYAAAFASPKTLDILAGLALDISEIVDKKDRKYQTALDVLKAREDSNWDEISEAFVRLLDSIKITTVEKESDEGDIFYDADEGETPEILSQSFTNSRTEVSVGDWVEI
ncbi:hypothetical protein TWF694_002082 [Orbilia ellipsospora]|uniref:Ankyrin n=1 Tax=Orbilia ellipsospora TaxID=2528407 RepID=A0AAV9X5S2_9PEZI